MTSILLGLRLGTVGVFLGTAISTVTTSLWVEPLMLYRHFLGSSAKPYFWRCGLFASVTFLLWYGVDLLSRGVGGGLWAVCLKRLAICVLVTNPAYLLLYHRRREFRLLLDKARLLLSRLWDGGRRETP